MRQADRIDTFLPHVKEAVTEGLVTLAPANAVRSYRNNGDSAKAPKAAVVRASG